MKKVLIHAVINLFAQYLLWVVINKHPENDLELFITSFLLTIGSFAWICFYFGKEHSVKDFWYDILLLFMVIISISAFIIQLQTAKERPIIETKQHKQSVCTHIKRLSVYNARASQTDSSPLITADNSKIDTTNFPTNWIALSRDLLQRFNKQAPYKFGDSVLLVTNNIKFDGIYVIHDTMDSSYVKTIDILLEESILHLDSNVIIYKI